VVTLLTVPLPEFPVELELVEPVDNELDPDAEPVSVDPVPELEPVLDAPVELDATVVAAERFASAGSCPDTSTIVIISHVATNSATAPPTMRRRIMLARRSRAVLIAAPRARASCALLSVIGQVPRCRSSAWMKLVRSFDPAPLSSV
jgi:hypothetical protein